jgi:hypothetical protein
MKETLFLDLTRNTLEIIEVGGDQGHLLRWQYKN